MNRSKVIVISIVGLLAIGVVLLFANAGSNDQSDDGFESSPESETDTEFTFEDMMETEKGNLFDAEKEMIDPNRTEKNSIERMLGEGDSLYAEENDPKILELQRQIELMERRRKSQEVVGAPVTTSSTTPPPLSQAEKEESYRQDLYRAREERLARSQDVSAPRTEVVATSTIGTGTIL